MAPFYNHTSTTWQGLVARDFVRWPLPELGVDLSLLVLPNPPPEPLTKLRTDLECMGINMLILQTGSEGLNHDDIAFPAA